MARIYNGCFDAASATAKVTVVWKDITTDYYYYGNGKGENAIKCYKEFRDMDKKYGLNDYTYAIHFRDMTTNKWVPIEVDD